jgi:hypothetical protein
VIQRSAERFHARFHIGVETLPFRQRASGGEDHLGGFGGELTARV